MPAMLTPSEGCMAASPNLAPLHTYSLTRSAPTVVSISARSGLTVAIIIITIENIFFIVSVFSV